MEDDVMKKTRLQREAIRAALPLLRPTAQQMSDVLDDLDEIETALAKARTDAFILAHAYMHDTKPPEAIISRALHYGDDTVTKETKP